jgi:hypothetical protein
MSGKGKREILKVDSVGNVIQVYQSMKDICSEKKVSEGGSNCVTNLEWATHKEQAQHRVGKMK